MSDIAFLRSIDDTWSKADRAAIQRKQMREEDRREAHADAWNDSDLLYYESLEINSASVRENRSHKGQSDYVRLKWLVPFLASILIMSFGLKLGFEGRVIWVLPSLMAGLYLLLFSLSQRVSERLGES